MDDLFDNCHAPHPSEKVLDGGRDMDLHRSSSREGHEDSIYLHDTCYPIQESSTLVYSPTLLEDKMHKDTFSGNERDGPITSNIDLRCAGDVVLTEPRNPAKDEKNEIPFPTPQTARTVDPNPTTHPLQQQILPLANHSQCDVEIESSKIHPEGYVWSVGHSSQKPTEKSCSQSSEKSRPTSLSTRPEWKLAPTNDGLGVGELYRDRPLDIHDQMENRSADSDSHDQSEKGKYVSVMQELPELPSRPDLPFLLGVLKNHPFGFHPDTSSDLLLEEDELEAINTYCPFPITGCKPMFTDESTFIIWMVDDRGFMYQYSRMEFKLILMGQNVVDGLTNYLYYQNRMRWLWHETKEWISKEEYDKRCDEIEFEEVVLEFVGPFEQIARGKSKSKPNKKKRSKGKKHKHYF